MCVLNILVKNLRIFTYFYVFIIPSGVFKSAEVFQNVFLVFFFSSKLAF